ncbi:hypothetical protein AURDEDRAFT_161614 [Auricularia subglabra TFB-10046 SS5]|nr:hypothetical protein AURDEDRAFT_161614 [Auricularia subglabra TFB-10046 SS5]
MLFNAGVDVVTTSVGENLPLTYDELSGDTSLTGEANLNNVGDVGAGQNPEAPPERVGDGVEEIFVLETSEPECPVTGWVQYAQQRFLPTFGAADDLFNPVQYEDPEYNIKAAYDVTVAISAFRAAAFPERMSALLGNAEYSWFFT